MESDILVKELGKSLGIELAFDNDGVCAFMADDMTVTIHGLPDGEIALVGDIGEPPPEGLEKLYRAMLEANHLFGGTAGATISFDSERGRFSLVKLFDCRNLDSDTFMQAVSKFVSVLEMWTKLTAEWRISPDDSRTEPDSVPPANAMLV